MQITRSNTLSLLGRIASGAAAITLCGLPAMAQSSPPLMVPVPFITIGAGNVTSSGASSSSVSSACTTGLKTTGGTNYGDGCVATEAGVADPWGAVVDKWGNVYFADEGHLYVRVIYAGAVTVDGVSNPAAQMIVDANAALSLTASSLVAGDIYAVAGGYTGALTSSGGTYYCNNAGSGTVALSEYGSGCPATQSYLKGPYNPAVDSDGNVFIADKSNSLVYVVLANASDLAASLVTTENSGVTAQIGTIYQIAGKSGSYVDGVIANNSGEVHAPYSVAVDSSENLYIADFTNNAIRMVNGPNTTTTGANSADCAGGSCGPGFIHTIAGSSCTSSGCTALATTPSSGVAAFGAAFVGPGSVIVDGSGNVYIGDNSDDASGIPTTVRVIYAGGTDNPLANLICLEQAANISDCTASSLTAGDVYTIAGSQATGSAGEGAGLLATNSGVRFDRIEGMGLDSHGNLYITDYGSHSEVSEVNASTGLLTYLSADGEYKSPSATYTVGDSCAANATTTSGPTALDEYGDGCPAPQSYADNTQGNLGIDSSGNLYLADYGDSLLRKLTFNGTIGVNLGGTAENITIGNGFPATAASNSAATQYLAFELEIGSTGDTVSNVSVSALTQGSSTSSEFTDPGASAGDTCTGSTTLVGLPSSSDYAADTVCIVPVKFTPARAGERSGALQISADVDSGTTPQILGTEYLNGVGNGAAIAIDPGVMGSTGSSIGTAPQGVATDSSGNTYIAFAGNGSVVSVPGGSLANGGSGLSEPYQIAVDGAGNVYVADSGNNRIAEFVPGSTTPVTVSTGFLTLSTPKGVALDPSGNLYIADTGNSRVLFVPNGNGAASQIGSGFEMPVAVAVDANRNLYVADSGLGAIVEIAAQTGTQSTVLSGIAPVGLAVDAAGNLEYVDSSAKEAVEIPVSGTTKSVVAGLTTPVGIALDPNGGLYVADTANTGISYYNRTASTQSFASTSSIVSATLTSIGNQSFVETGSTPTQTDSTDFEIEASSSDGCDVTSQLTLTAGSNCGITALFTPVGTGNLSDTVTLAGNGVNSSSVTLNLSGNNSPTVISTSTVLSGPSPASPVYGETVVVTAQVTQSSGNTAPTGNVTFTVDGVAQTPVALSGGEYSLNLTTLNAGQHSVSASYAGAGSFSSSVSNKITFTVAPIALTATATSQTVTYGQTIPALTGVLGSGVLAQDQGNVTAVFSTKATSTSAIGSYPITVSLTGSAAANYTVTLSGSPTVTIQPATVTVAISNATKVYGSANPSFTGTLTGVLAQDAANVAAVYSTAATATSAVGSYSITATGLTGSAAGNYTLGAVTTGTLTVTQLAITATATSETAGYGQAIPAISGSLSGVLTQDVGNVTAVFYTAASSTSPVGSYPISLTGLTGSAAGNYTATLTGSPTVTIQKATVSVAVNSASRAYGAANPAFSGVLTGVLTQDAGNVAAVYSTSATTTSAVGTYSIAVTGLTGSAAGNYTLGAVTNGTLTVTQAGTTTAVTTSNASVDLDGNVTFTATVSSLTSGTPSGSVTFYSGTEVIGTPTLTGGVATLTNPSITLIGGTYSITATYSGSTDFTTSTSPALTETVALPVVGGTLSTSSLSISSGSSGTVTLTLAAQGGYVGTATFSCANLPANMTCTFNPTSATFTSSTTTATTTLTISTSGSSSAAVERPRAPGRKNGLAALPALCLLLPSALFGLFGLFGLGNRRMRAWQRRLMALMAVIAIFTVTAAFSGCGGSSAAGTAAGTYTINLEITAGTVQMVPLTVTVEQ